MSILKADFTKADSRNLPAVDLVAVMRFFNENQQFIGAEMQGSKVERSAREEYGDNAIGYVQLKRTNEICAVVGKISPEHSVTKKPYTVTCEINESSGYIVKATCEDCVASKGGCKHVVALLMWLHRRSEEPSPTSIVSYWEKPKLSQVGSGIKFILAKDIGGASTSKDERIGSACASEVFKNFIDHCDTNGIVNQLIRYLSDSDFDHLSLHSLVCEFHIIYEKRDRTYENFIDFCKSKMGEVHEIEGTQEQYNCAVWHELRYGRITASIVLQASRCKTDGALTEVKLTKVIFGAKIFESAAMKRGKEVEKAVLKELNDKKFNIKKCGLFLSKDYPIFGASPDGITESHIIEIKAPFKENTFQNYINNGNITPKCMAQIQLQMFLCKRQKAYFVVADPFFETTKTYTIKEVDFDAVLCDELLKNATTFWIKYIFTKLNA